MTDTGEKYEVQDYDHLIIVASWGLPKEYNLAKYELELNRVSGGKVERSKITYDKEYYSSTAAMRNLLKEKVGISEDKLSLLIFSQDTILLERIISEREDYFPSGGNVKTRKRNELYKELFQILYDSKKEAAHELDVQKREDYSRIVRFVPGVITGREGAYLFTWRYIRVYDLLLAGVILFMYDKLLKIHQEHNVKSLAILMDTTHGINYFVTALREGVLKATALYAFNTLGEGGLESNSTRTLDEVIIYHYNSDPRGPVENGTPSLKLHLLDEVAVVRRGKPLFNGLYSTIEERVSREGLNKLHNQLSGWWRDIEWEKVLESLLFLSKGLLVWALRAALDLSQLPSIETLESALESVDLKFSSKENNYIISYAPKEGRTPLTPIIEYSLMGSSLRKLAERCVCTNDDGFDILEDFARKLNGELTKNELNSALQNILSKRDEYKCFELEKVRQATNLVYTSPYLDLISNEITNLKNYLVKGGRGRKKIEHIYMGPRRSIYLIKFNDSHLLIQEAKNGGKNGGVEKRTIYAHAGLAYGLPWFALGRRVEGGRSNITLYLGRSDKVAQVVLYARSSSD